MIEGEQKRGWGLKENDTTLSECDPASSAAVVDLQKGVQVAPDGHDTVEYGLTGVLVDGGSQSTTDTRIIETGGWETGSA